MTVLNLKIKVHGNPDYGQNPNKIERTEISAITIAELRKNVREWQLQSHCGGGNWGICTLYKNDKIIGYMSYNGRIWKDKKWNSNTIEISDSSLCD